MCPETNCIYSRFGSAVVFLHRICSEMVRCVSCGFRRRWLKWLKPYGHVCWKCGFHLQKDLEISEARTSHNMNVVEWLLWEDDHGDVQPDIGVKV